MDAIPPPGMAVCDHCGVRLNSHVRYEEGRPVEVAWRHGYDADHDPKPRQVASVEVSAMLCDFCGQRGPTWSFATARNVVAYAIQDGPHGSTSMLADAENAWAACDGCAELITAGRRDALYRRAAEAARAGDAGRRAALRAVQDAFFASGPRPPTRLEGVGRFSTTDGGSDRAGTIADQLANEISTQRRRLITTLPEIRPLTDTLASAATAGMPPELPAGLLRSLLARRHGELIAREALMFANVYAATRLWRKNRLVYSVDSDLWAHLGDLDLDFRLPLAMLRHLPHPNPFLMFPEPLTVPVDRGQLWQMVGAFIVGQHSESEAASDGDFLCDTHAAGTANSLKLVVCGAIHTGDGQPVLAHDGSPDIALAHLTVPTHGERTVAELADYTSARSGPSLTTGTGEQTDVTAMLRRALSLLTYLCSRNADLHERPTARPRSSKKARRAAQRRTTPAQVIEVGYRIGAELRAHARRRDQSREDGGQAGTGRTVAPHIRRMHRHWYRVGPGREQLELKWLGPIAVNMRGQAAQTTVIPIRPEQPPSQ